MAVRGRVGADPWLDRWLPLVRERSGGRPVLELGCGAGRDTVTLRRAGQRVIAVDRSPAALAAAKVRVPAASFHRRNLLDPFPVGESGAGVVLASLSLHYFSWADTVELVDRIRRTLEPGGILLCRLNSTKDRNFGAAGRRRLAQNFHLVAGRPKRFFDRKSVRRLFSEGWTLLSLEERAIGRYVLPKVVWEAVLERKMLH